MNRHLILSGILALTMVWMAEPAMSNEQGRRNTTILLAGLTGVAAYEKQPYIAAGLGIAALYAQKRLNDDIRNNRAEEAYLAGYRQGYCTGSGSATTPANCPSNCNYTVPDNGSSEYCYQNVPYNSVSSPQVVPASYRKSYSQSIRYKGFSYQSSESNSATFRSPPRQSQSTSPQVIVIVVPNGNNSGACPQAPPQSYKSCDYSSGSKNQYSPAPTRYQAAPVKYGEDAVQVLPSSYYNRSSQRISYRGGSYSHSQSSSATFRPAPQQPRRVAVYYGNR